jgi:uncharacterized protein HemX
MDDFEHFLPTPTVQTSVVATPTPPQHLAVRGASTGGRGGGAVAAVLLVALVIGCAAWKKVNREA